MVTSPSLSFRYCADWKRNFLPSACSQVDDLQIGQIGLALGVRHLRDHAHVQRIAIASETR